jgi:uncharacterized protein YbcI
MDAYEPTKQELHPSNGAQAEAQIGQLTQITRALVTIYKEHLGRGPRYARSHYAGPNAIVCILEGTLTPVEKSLAAIGEHQELQHVRQLFQHAAETSLRAAVEAITGRVTAGCMSGNDAQNDLASEIFVFAPRPVAGSAAG